MSKGADWWQGSLYGVFRSIGKGTAEDIHLAIPFDMTITLQGRGRNLKGTYNLQAWPFVVKPRRKKTLPGLLDFFPGATSTIRQGYNYEDYGRVLDSTIIDEKYTFGTPIKNDELYVEGDVEVELKRERMILKFKDIPQGFKLNGSIKIKVNFMKSRDVSEKIIEQHQEMWIDLGFFSKKASYHLKQLEMRYNHPMLRYDTKIEEIKKCSKYPNGGKDYYSARAEMVHVQTWYHTDQTEFVHDVDTTELRDMFLSNPDLADKLKQQSEKEIAEGLHEGLYSKKLVDMLASMTGSSPITESIPSLGGGAGASGFDVTEEPPLKGTPRQGIELALRYLMEFSKGSNGLMLVIDGCWTSFQYRRRKNELHFQVAGNKYIPDYHQLSNEDIKILTDMGIIIQDGYIELYTANFAEPSQEDISDFIDLVFKVYSAVYRIDIGKEGYIQIDLGTETPEAIKARDSLSGFFPKRRDKRKFFWRWDIEPEAEPTIEDLVISKIKTKKGIIKALTLLAKTGNSKNSMQLDAGGFSVQITGHPDDDSIHCSFEASNPKAEQIACIKKIGFEGDSLYKLDFDISSNKRAIRKLGRKLLKLFTKGFELDDGTKGSLVIRLQPPSREIKKGLRRLGKLLPDNDGETFHWRI